MNFVFKFRDADETLIWIGEREVAVQSDDFGKDLPSVQALLRKHDAAERDLLALQEKVTLLMEDGARMRDSHPDEAAQIDEKLAEVTRRWEALRSRATARKQRLDDSQLVHRFLSEYRDLIGFIHDTQGLSKQKIQKRDFGKQITQIVLSSGAHSQPITMKLCAT